MSYPDEAALAEEFKLALSAASDAGMSESDVAHFFGVSKVTVRRWKEGLSHPHPALMKRYIPDLRSKAQ